MPCVFLDVFWNVGQFIVLPDFAAEEDPPAVGAASVEALFPGPAAVQGSAAAQGAGPGADAAPALMAEGRAEALRQEFPARTVTAAPAAALYDGASPFWHSPSPVSFASPRTKRRS